MRLKSRYPVAATAINALLLLSLLAACAPKPAAPTATPIADVETAARTFVGFLADGRFQEATGMFDETVAEALPTAKLKAAWDSILRQVGKFEKIAETRAAQESGYRVVYVTCDFADQPLDVKVVFDQDGRISGLWFLPVQSQIPYAPPPYADPDAFTETEYTVGDGDCPLPATLTLPKGDGPFPAVVLVHGSGPNDRDETIGPNKPFKDLAWGLATAGVAVLRYEKRTKQCAAQLADALATFTVDDEMVNDALAAAQLLRTVESIDPRRVFILGHSLGGMLSPRIAARDSQLAGLIVLAGNTRDLLQLMLEQTEYIISLDGTVDESDAEQLEELRLLVERVRSLDIGEGEAVLGASRAYWADIMAYDPVETAKGLSLPMLILQGERDYQVTMTDFEGWKTGLEGRSNVTFISSPDLNHLFMAGTGKSTPEEYNQAGNVSQEVVEDIAAWVLSIGAGT